MTVNPKPPQGYCPCGQKLHYQDPRLEEEVARIKAELGPDVVVHCVGRKWLVNRDWIALHGLRAWDLPALGFTEITGEKTV